MSQPDARQLLDNKGNAFTKYNDTHDDDTLITVQVVLYLSVGKNVTDVTIRGNGRVIAFDTWDDFVDAIDITKSVWARDDNTNTTYDLGKKEDNNNEHSESVNRSTQ